jgi:hypothetical protein
VVLGVLQPEENAVSRICSIVIVLLFTACAVEGESLEPTAGEIDEAPAEDREVDESVDATASLAGHYCVDQSSAAADRISCEVFACFAPVWDTRLSRNHPVSYHSCVGSTYVNVYSLWTGSCYKMRRDALRRC